MNDTPDGPDLPEQPDERWAKYDRWRQGDLQLPDPQALLGEPGLGEHGEPTRVPWRAREGFAVFIIHLLVAAVFTVPVAFTLENEDSIIAVTILVFELALLLSTWGWVRLRFGMGLRAFGFRDMTGANLGRGVLVGLVGLFSSFVISTIIATIIESVTGTPPQEPKQIPLAQQPEGAILWVVGVSVVVLAPLAEEMFFRGFVFAGLRRWARLWPSVIWSAVVFAIPHIQPNSSPSASVLVLPAIFVLGIYLAWITDRTRSLVPAITAHMLFNLSGFTLLFLL